MVSLSVVRASNANLKSSPPGLVAVFVGGTSGIGLFTARELVRNTTSPHLYLVGRNHTEATKITQELQALNSTAQVDFIQKDVSLLKNVDEVCREIQSKEKHVNLLFMTCGYFVFRGREETTEGLDKKFALHYYTRMRFINQLQPLLEAASSTSTSTLSRVVAVLDPQPGLKSEPHYSDLSLKNVFSLNNCMVHASSMTNLAFSRFASQYPGTSFVHAFPSIVETGVGRDAWGMFAPVAKILITVLTKPMQVSQMESGERHLYAATSASFAPKAKSESSTCSKTAGDSVEGGGSYLLNWNNDCFADSQKAKRMREGGAEKKIWEHTEQVFRKICEEDGRY